MEAILDIAAALVVGGLRRVRRPPKPVVRVARTAWLRVALGLLAAQGVVVATATVLLVRFAVQAMNDDLFFVLGVIVFPFVLLGVGAAVGLLGWLYSLICKLDACDVSARPELAVLGVGTLVLGVPLVQLGVAGWATVTLGLAEIALALAPAVWEPRAPTGPRDDATG